MKLLIQHLILAANENTAANEAVVAGAFTIMQPDGFELEYGEYPHSVGVQLFDRESAQSMANELSSLLGKLTRGFRGVPVYAGHPDHPDQRMAAQYPDRKARGWIKEIIVGDTSARFITAYNELGKGEVDDAQWAGYSPLWLMQPVANQRGKFRPMILKSMALTNNPNMPVKPLIVANEDEPSQSGQSSQNPNPMNPTLKAKLLKLLGLADDTTDEALDQAANDFCDKALAEKDKPAPEPEKKDPPAEDPEKEKEDEKEAIASANEAVTQARAAALASREARVDMGLDQLVTAGRITVAERPALRTDLIACANEADVTAGLEKLKAAKPKLQTSLTHSANIAKDKGKVIAANDGDARRVLRDQAVEAVRKEKPGISDTVAWGIAASRDKDLFAH